MLIAYTTVGRACATGRYATIKANFVTANDFTDKTVIPFCTSQASGYGESGEQLAEKAGTGNWIVGGNFFGEASDEEISEWLGGLEK